MYPINERKGKVPLPGTVFNGEWNSGKSGGISSAVVYRVRFLLDEQKSNSITLSSSRPARELVADLLASRIA